MRKAHLSVMCAAATFLCAACSPYGAGNPPFPSSSAPSSVFTIPAGTATPAVFALPYTPADSLDPYSAKSESNRELGMLLYDPLFRLNSGFGADGVLAAGIQTNGTSCVITLGGHAFSDGSPVTADDVAASMIAAMSSATSPFKAQLSSTIAYYSVQGPDSISIVMKHVSPNPAGVLDFPIIKAGEAPKDADGKSLPPIGSGRYTYAVDDKGKPYLQAARAEIKQKKIALLPAPDNDALAQDIATGQISLTYADLSGGNYPRMRGKTSAVPLTNLVFLGMNCKNPLMADPNIRQALSAAIGRQTLADSDYSGEALPAAGLLPPAYSPAKATQDIAPRADTTAVSAKLKAAGYDGPDERGYFQKDGKPLALNLLVNSENNARLSAASSLQTALKAAGMDVSIDSQPFAEYTKSVKSGTYDLYLGEMALPKNLDLSPLFGADVSAGLPVNCRTSAAVASYASGQGALSDVLNAFSGEMPLIPLLYRSGIVAYSDKIQGQPTATMSDIFFNIEMITIDGGN